MAKNVAKSNKTHRPLILCGFFVAFGFLGFLDLLQFPPDSLILMKKYCIGFCRILRHYLLNFSDIPLKCSTQHFKLF